MREVTAGELCHRITIEEPVETRDDHGGVTTEWIEFKSLFASAEWITGNEQNAAPPPAEADADYRFRTWYFDGLTAKMRISFCDRIFDIQSFGDHSGRRKTMEILAKERKV